MVPLLIVAGILALTVLALAVPVEIEVYAAIHGRPKLRTRFRLFCGLVSFNVEGSTGDKERGKKETGGIPHPKKLVEAAQVEGIWPGLWKLARGLAPSVKVKRLAADLTVSLGDDYYTGMLAGLFIPLVLYLDQRFDGGISLRPAFEEDLFLDGDAHAVFSLHPLQMVLPCLVFVFSTQFGRVMRVIGRGR